LIPSLKALYRIVHKESADLLLYTNHKDVQGILNIAFFVVFKAISFFYFPLYPLKGWKYCSLVYIKSQQIFQHCRLAQPPTIFPASYCNLLLRSNSFASHIKILQSGSQYLTKLIHSEIT